MPPLPRTPSIQHEPGQTPATPGDVHHAALLGETTLSAASTDDWYEALISDAALAIGAQGALALGPTGSGTVPTEGTHNTSVADAIMDNMLAQIDRNLDLADQRLARM